MGGIFHNGLDKLEATWIQTSVTVCFQSVKLDNYEHFWSLREAEFML